MAVFSPTELAPSAGVSGVSPSKLTKLLEGRNPWSPALSILPEALEPGVWWSLGMWGQLGWGAATLGTKRQRLNKVLWEAEQGQRLSWGQESHEKGGQS